MVRGRPLKKENTKKFVINFSLGQLFSTLEHWEVGIGGLNLIH